MDAVFIIIIASSILLLPIIFFTIHRLYRKLKKRSAKRASRVSVIPIAPLSHALKSSVILPPVGIAPTPHTSKVTDTPETTGQLPEVNPVNRQISTCYLNELKLMDIGPLPRDQAVLEQQRRREREKRSSLGF
ncbi:hypothetical protein KIN20_005068 [Parelaphostrongylus tenuis]|uniref:Uncharacterized protein n=1 Tax=Parelaphostrongylus tenuis TaxID=148309 RepID=A0AAD5M1J4_PARTN|nr:hypothetical protein KIN20_005068 [Parelaphostrongylus tenuis]